ncbi:hypothetical protein [Sphingomonas sp. 22176]|uniref:hypothetical protein n=1 Tax=Sphingomonas sp. 22176 TaxID=3453884 RepID=UPI003F86AB9E
MSPISASFSVDAFGAASFIGTAVMDELISQRAAFAIELLKETRGEIDVKR